MGSGIAQVSAQAGLSTIIKEISAELLEKGVSRIGRDLARLEEKQKIGGEERQAALSRIRTTTDLGELADCDLVIEAIVEDREAKGQLWSELDDICSPEAIFASNTSSLGITEMAAATRHPDRLIGLHFFNPVPVMQLVEVVRTLATSRGVLDRASDFVRALGKEPIECRDRSGFVVNRLLVPYLMDCIRALEQGVASVDAIDRAMHLGAAHPMGPFTLCDFVGLDTLARIGDIMFDEYREQRYASPPLLKRMVAAGLLGRKAGKGFYDYSQDPPLPVDLGL
jgi:3-hydroxybutyryl-CoA dehydrogenase